jgi:hypothetical protein
MFQSSKLQFQGLKLKFQGSKHKFQSLKLQFQDSPVMTGGLPDKNQRQQGDQWGTDYHARQAEKVKRLLWLIFFRCFFPKNGCLNAA